MKHLVCIPLLLLLAPYARPNSAGTYGKGAGEFVVSTKLTTGPVHNELSVTVSHNGESKTTSNVVADPDGDGKDVLRSEEISIGGATVRWKDGKLQQKNADGSWSNKKKPKNGCHGDDDGAVRSQSRGSPDMGEEGGSMPQRGGPRG